MQKIFELWLDESGEFDKEKELQREKKNPSLVGGLLIEQERVEEIDFRGLIDGERIHATELRSKDKSEYILPILETMRERYGARQVFFENMDYEEAESNRQLYLRIMAEGLLQLMLTLNARYESVVLHVLIAQRQDPAMPRGQGRIREEEYLRALQLCMEQKKREHKVFLSEDSALDFDIQVANRESKLQLADFACNTRLTRGSKAFAEVQHRVLALYDDAYLFALTEVSSENYIKQSLVQGHIADAIMELYTTWDPLDHSQELEIIMARMQETNYRLVKSEMKQCSAKLMAYAAMQDDYEQGEKFLNILRTELVPVLRDKEQPHKHFHFALLLQLADMYLREGDIVAAEKVVCECREVQQQLGNSLEEVFTYYQLVEKEALLAINSFAFEQGKKIMEEACDSFRRVMKCIDGDINLQKRFTSICSEYYGDALCMQIYAMMFLQRENPGMYEELVRLSDEALVQYPNTEGELERHRQYRSHIEAEKGNYEEALLWLMQAKLYTVRDITNQTIYDFVEAVTDTEGEISSCYYLMYYLTIMVTAKRAGNSLADAMYEVLCKQERLLLVAELAKRDSAQDYSNIVDFDEIKEEESGICYHPREVLYWKYASFLLACGEYEKAVPFYARAIKICFKYDNYQTMLITGLGIAAEKICCLLEMGNKAAAKSEYKVLRKRMQELQNQEMNPKTREFVESLNELLASARGADGVLQSDALWKMAEKITY